MPRPVEELGVQGSVLRRLREAGLTTVEALAAASVQRLCELGIPMHVAQSLLAQARRALGLGFRTALELKRERSGQPRITTGSRNLDALLGGGVEVRTITEFFGEYGTGKTQICHQLAVNVQLPPERGGLGMKAVYIDAEGTFRWERVEAMARALGLDPDRVMENIYYVRAVSSDHQMAVAEQLVELVPREGIGLVVVDSVTGHFRAEYPGRENLVARQQRLRQHLHQLAVLAELYGVAVVVTNQVRARPDALFGDPTTAVGGHTLYHVPGVRVQLRRGRGRVRVARVVDAPHLPEAEAVFAITEAGVRDPE